MRSHPPTSSRGRRRGAARRLRPRWRASGPALVSVVLALLACAPVRSAPAAELRSLLADPDRAILEGRTDELRELCLALEGRPGDPDWETARALLGRLAASPAEARARLAEGPTAPVQLAELALLEGRPGEAGRLLSAAAAGAPLPPREALLLAHCRRVQGRPAAALASISQANFAGSAYVGLADLAEAGLREVDGQLEAAGRLYGRLATGGEGAWRLDGLLGLARVAAATGDREQATLRYRQVLAEQPAGPLAEAARRGLAALVERP